MTKGVDAASSERERGAPGDVGAFGECEACGVRHSLPQGRARTHALSVMEEFRRIRRLDYRVGEADADPALSFDVLFAQRGNMFGVLECRDRSGASVFLRAFSSLSEGIREIEGWVLPILSASVYQDVILPAQSKIKRLSAEIECVVEGAASESEALRLQRRKVSQELWERMCTLYQFRNFRGEERPLREAVLPGTSVTGGMGECCAPKLLQHAALHGLRPISIAEFYWGEAPTAGDSMEKRSASSSAESGRPAMTSSRKERERARAVQRARSARRVEGQFYPSCEARCQPLLGFMLCGLDE